MEHTKLCCLLIIENMYTSNIDMDFLCILRHSEQSPKNNLYAASHCHQQYLAVDWQFK